MFWGLGIWCFGDWGGLGVLGIGGFWGWGFGVLGWGRVIAYSTTDTGCIAVIGLNYTQQERANWKGH